MRWVLAFLAICSLAAPGSGPAKTTTLQLGTSSKGRLFLDGVEVAPPFVFSATLVVTGKDTTYETVTVNRRVLQRSPTPQAPQSVAAIRDPRIETFQRIMASVPVRTGKNSEHEARMRQVALRLAREPSVDSARFVNHQLVVYWRGANGVPFYFEFEPPRDPSQVKHGDGTRVIRQALDRNGLVVLAEGVEIMVPPPMAERAYAQLDSVRRGLNPRIRIIVDDEVLAGIRRATR
jgi:hypothetical protein